MTALRQLGVRHLRNLTEADIALSPGCNFFFGENGSGKTSLLEAVYLLGRARSFRSNLQRPLIQQDQGSCTVHGVLANGTRLGVSKVPRGTQQIRINGANASNAAELAQVLPLQLINSDTFRILEGSPKVRRHFMDWGVFHVEHAFVSHWRRAQKALEQRNHLLKQGAGRQEIEAWNQEYASHGEAIADFRMSYVEKLGHVLQGLLSEMLPDMAITLGYEPGWDREDALIDHLSRNLERDRRYGHTTHGPHRADLKIKMGSNAAVEMLSRGQQKLLVSAMKIAQGFLLYEESAKHSIFLVDDLPAELDRKNRQAVTQLLQSMGCQVFITGVEEGDLKELWQPLTKGECGEMRLFHVKHGRIQPLQEANNS